jgi:hypothetical protein
MKHPGPWTVVLLIVLTLVFNVPAGILLDQLLKHEYRFFPDLWDADGKPSGFLWCPRDANWFYTSVRPFPPTYRWVYRAPEWIRADPRLYRKLTVIRALHFVGSSVFLIFIFHVLI